MFFFLIKGWCSDFLCLLGVCFGLEKKGAWREADRGIASLLLIPSPFIAPDIFTILSLLKQQKLL